MVEPTPEPKPEPTGGERPPELYYDCTSETEPGSVAQVAGAGTPPWQAEVSEDFCGFVERGRKYTWGEILRVWALCAPVIAFALVIAYAVAQVHLK